MLLRREKVGSAKQMLANASIGVGSGQPLGLWDL